MYKLAIKITVILLLIVHFTFAQSSLNGTVKDFKGKTIPGAILHIENSQYTISSDAMGAFNFERLKDGLTKVQCRMLGFEDSSYSVIIQGKTELNIVLKLKPFLTEEVTVLSTRSGKNSGMSVNTLKKEDIDKLNTGQDLPYIMQLLPSVVVTSDAGNGIGYTGIRIRGSDATRVNVTINGIPLNDAESQGVYWVNLPDFASSTENIEVTRGVGVSTNGSGAFGGTINILSQQLNDSAFIKTSNAVGTFNTIKNNISFGTGLINDHFSLEGRVSKITSDGYLDRGKSDLKSFYVSSSFKDEKNILRLNIFSGKEITYQSWYGVPESRINGDVNAMNDYIANNGLSEEDAANLLNSGRNYNYYTYKNQNDNYQQDHYQFLYSRSLGDATLLNIGLHATKGRGFFEEFKNDQNLSDYNISTAGTPDSLITNSDLIRRRWLDNWFYGATWSLSNTSFKNLNLHLGGAVNRYEGDHFGEVIWARTAGNSEITDKYYFNDAKKDDFNSYLKADWSISKKIIIYADMQYRYVTYSYEGPNEFGTFLQQDVQHHFLNPKAGITLNCSKNIVAYASFSVAQKEPNRDDYTQSTINSRPIAEKLFDYEAGVKWSGRTLRASMNFYYMDYMDQLILTGQVNDVGSYTRKNIDESYRSGIELEAALQVHPKLVLQGNLTLSENKIKNFTEYVDAFDMNFDYLGQEKINYKNTTIAFSPAIVSSGMLQYKVFKGAEINFITKYVSEQYLDNTKSKKSLMPEYLVGDVRLSYSILLKRIRKIQFDVLLNNVFNSLYVSNGYTWGYIYDQSRVRENFFYPQADFNVMGQMTISF